jgi:hypothetical protein
MIKDDDVIDGIHYLTIGATGAAIRDANADSGGMHLRWRFTLPL